MVNQEKLFVNETNNTKEIDRTQENNIKQTALIFYRPLLMLFFIPKVNISPAW